MLVSKKQFIFVINKLSLSNPQNQTTKMDTILVIEDNEDILENLTEYLEMEGYKILGANNGKRGIELAREFIPDLIVCDVLMHAMNGHEVLQLLLDSHTTFRIPFIFSTSMSEKIDKAESLLLGADDYIIKPFALEDLLRMVKTWIKSGSARETSLLNME
jgi:DNA-binding response OmpR family regulator